MTAYAKDVLIEPACLAERLDDDAMRIVEVDENPALYREAHIPGAIGFDWQTDLQDPVQRAFIGPAALADLLGGAGISNQHLIVLYGDRNNWFAAYAYWLLRYYGHDRLRLLNGPRERWVAEGHPTTTERPAHAPATFTVGAPDESLRSRRDEVLAALGGSTRLIDARSPQEYSGELVAMPGYENEGAQRSGHIPGALSIPWAQAVRENGTFKSADELAELYRAEGAITGAPVISYCRIGERSAHTWFVLHELLGYDQVKNYDGSWTEWGNLVDAPIERSYPFVL
jgi:thiosulfate/3-mercaptopyruvate sulfurtransferase